MDSFQILGVDRGATKSEIKTAYTAKMLGMRFLQSPEKDRNVQLVRDAYRDLMKGFGDTSHLVQFVTLEDLENGVLCRCGSIYSPGDVQGNTVECMSCSCSLKIT